MNAATDITSAATEVILDAGGVDAYREKEFGSLEVFDQYIELTMEGLVNGWADLFTAINSAITFGIFLERERVRKEQEAAQELPV